MQELVSVSMTWQGECLSLPCFIPQLWHWPVTMFLNSRRWSLSALWPHDCKACCMGRRSPVSPVETEVQPSSVQCEWAEASAEARCQQSQPLSSSEAGAVTYSRIPICQAQNSSSQGKSQRARLGFECILVSVGKKRIVEIKLLMSVLHSSEIVVIYK